MTLHRDRVLIVEDEFLIAEGLKVQVEDQGLSVCGIAATADQAVDLACETRPFLVLCDIRLAGPRDGVDAARDIHTRVGSEIVFVTGSREPSTLDRIRENYPARVLFKPVSDHQLREAIRQTLGGS